jgi:hypothetical protein
VSFDCNERGDRLDVARHAKRSRRSLYRGMAATPMFEAVVAVQNITDLAPTPIGVVIGIARRRFGRHVFFVPPPKTNDTYRMSIPSTAALQNLVAESAHDFGLCTSIDGRREH